MKLNRRIDLPAPVRRAAAAGGIQPLRVYLLRGAWLLGVVVVVAAARACARG